jgi:ligand-binding sensor domain-containing protein/signal transduction histidine kinase
VNRVRILAALALCLTPLSFAATGYSRRIWRTQDGLPQSEIQALTQTPDGYLWIGTPGGLVRFDGVRFVVFDRSNTPSFRDDSVLALAVGLDQSLWIGSEGGGLLQLLNGRFRAFGTKEGLTNLFVRALHVDRAGTVWVGTDRGLFRLHNGKLLRQDGQPDLPIASVQTMAEDRAGRLWVGGFFGLMYEERGKLHRYPASTSVRSIFETAGGTLWFATTHGLQKLSAAALGSPLTPAAAPAGAHASKLYEDRDGNLWIGAVGEGLHRLRGETYGEEDFLPDNSVLSLFEDRERNLWVGTHDGLLRLTKKAVTSVTTREGLASNNVSTIYQDPQSVLWLATVAGQLYRVAGGTAVPFVPPAGCGEIRAGNVFSDSHGALWVGTLDRGIARIEHGKAAYFTTAGGLRNDHARQFQEDHAGRLWVATGSGLLRWTGAGFQSYYLEDGLAYGSVRALVELRHGPHAGDLLAGTDGGLNRIHDTQIVRDPELAQFAGQKIWAIHEDAGGALWFGTRGSGLMQWKNGKITKLGTRDGLPSNSIYQILADGKDRLWMSSPAGIFSANREDLDHAAAGARDPAPMIAYGIAEGLESTQMNGGIQPAGCRTASGDLWFPSVKGAVRIDPNELRAGHSPPVLIESMLADDSPISLAEASIPPGRRKLEIHFTVCNLGSPERITFKYKLEGFDEAWAPASNRRVAYYANLRPGNYRFRVMAADAASQQNPSEASVAFRWQPHFYQTAWFFAVCAALACLAAWAALRFYVRQTKSRYALLLAERTRLAREMHDTVIQGCVGVSTLLEAAGSVRNRDPAKAMHLLDQARAQVRSTLDEARQAVWDLRHSSLHGDLESSLTGFARQLTVEHGIEVTVHVTGARVHPDEQADRNLLLVAREAIWNALAHGQPRHIAIELTFGPESAALEVTDDGRGFEPSTARGAENGHFGILGMRERVEHLGGAFEIRSGPGEGARVLASVPLKS